MFKIKILVFDKIQAIKGIRHQFSLGLKEVRDLVENDDKYWIVSIDDLCHLIRSQTYYNSWQEKNVVGFVIQTIEPYKPETHVLNLTEYVNTHRRLIE